MNLYVSSYFEEEHDNFRKVNKDYDEICELFEKDEPQDHTDPSLRWLWPTRTYNEFDVQAFLKKINSCIEVMNGSDLGKWWDMQIKMGLWSRGQESVDYLKGIAMDTGEDDIIRLYAIVELLGENDYFADKDIKEGKPGTLSEEDEAYWSEMFFDLYSSASEEVKNDSHIKCSYQAYHCIKMRYLWYPLGDDEVLDDIYDFLMDISNNTSDDLVILRNDRELSILAGWYGWSERKERAIEICDFVLNRDKYLYSLNIFKIKCREIKAQIYLDEDNIEAAFEELKENLNDYNLMKVNADFTSLTAGSYDERETFMMFMYSTYEYLDAICEKDFKAYQENLFRDVPGANMEEKLNLMDRCNYRHQWGEHVQSVRERVPLLCGRINNQKTMHL